MATLVNLQQAASLSSLNRAASRAHAGRGPVLQACQACVRPVVDEDQCGLSLSRRRMLLAGPGLALTAGVAAVSGLPTGAAAMPGRIYTEWEEVSVPVDPEVDLLDVAFVPGDWDHGFLVGTQKTLLETRDGGRSWTRCKVPSGLEDQDTFTAIRFADREGWIIGEPAVLVYTEDGGSNWRRMPLDLKPAETPLRVEAFGEKRAELVTTDGAVYATADGGVSWTSKVLRSQASTEGRLTGGLCTIDRSHYGEYVAVSSEANAYLTWTPDQPWWQSHRDTDFVNIKNVGWLSDGGLWLVSQGGGLYFATGPKELNEFQESKVSIKGIGIQDVSFRTRYEAWATGAGGLLLRTVDGGETWTRDLVRQDFTTDLSRIRFVDVGKGFMMGRGGVLFRHVLYKRKLQYIDVNSLRNIIRASEEVRLSGAPQRL